MSKESPPSFGTVYGLIGWTSNITQYNHPNSGWAGVALAVTGESTDSSWQWVWSDDWPYATADDFPERVAILERWWISQRNWAEIDAEIQRGCDMNASFFYVDEAQWDAGCYGVTNGQIDTVCFKVHAKGKLLAVSEPIDCWPTMAYNPRFYKYVDILMPEGYFSSCSDLVNFYSFIRNIHQGFSSVPIEVVPILGYRVPLHENGPFYTQLDQAWGSPFIENAVAYGTLNKIYFYLPDTKSLDNLGALTSYLEQGGYIQGLTRGFSE